MTKVTTIKINKPMPDKLRKALDRKRERLQQIRSGEIDVSLIKPIKRIV